MEKLRETQQQKSSEWPLLPPKPKASARKNARDGTDGGNMSSLHSKMHASSYNTTNEGKKVFFLNKKKSDHLKNDALLTDSNGDVFNPKFFLLLHAKYKHLTSKQPQKTPLRDDFNDAGS